MMEETLQSLESELNGRKLLIVTDSRVWSPGEGRNFRFTRLMSALCRYGMRIDLVTSRESLKPEEIEGMQAAGISTIITGESAQGPDRQLALRSRIRELSPGCAVYLFRKARRTWGLIRSALESERRRAPRLSELRSPQLSRLTADYVHKYHPDFVMVEYLMHSYALDFLQEMPGCTRPVTMIDTYDVAHQLCEARQRHGERVPFLVNREEEQEILSTFDIIIAIQDQDRRTFEAMLPGRTVVTCLPACEANPVPPSTDQSTSLIFVGGDSRKNSYGLMQFLKHAWPRVRNVHSDADLTVVGTVCRRFEEESYPGVFFEGYVDDLRESYARADVAICPVTYGGGLKIKVFEALAFGRPVVATMHSAIGFSVTEGNGLLVADDWESFAAILNDLFDDQGRVRAMGQSAAEYVDREFSESYVMRDLVAAMCQHLTQRAAHKGQA